jgi:hypothetical protein
MSFIAAQRTVLGGIGGELVKNKCHAVARMIA